MKDIISIPFSRKKMLKLIVINSLMILGIAGIIALILSANTLNLYYLGLSLLIFVAAIILFFYKIETTFIIYSK